MSSSNNSASEAGTPSRLVGDIDYQPSEEDSDDIEYFDAEDDDGWDDAAMPDVHEAPDAAAADVNAEDPDDDAQTTLTAAELFRLLGSHGLQRILRTHRISGLRFELDQDDSDDDANEIFGTHGFRRRRSMTKYEPPKVPSDAGRELMYTGQYGSNPHYADKLKRRKEKLATRLMWRELAYDGRLNSSRSISQGLIPASRADKIIHYDARCYSGQFSDDGNFFFTACQDFKVRMYDTSNPQGNWKYYKTVDYTASPQWTLTDASLSPDNKYLAYSSIRSIVCLAETDPNTESEPILLNFSDGSHSNLHHGASAFGIWSVRFSGDGKELVAGTSDPSVVVYDIERQKPLLRLANHEDDVNAVCFGDKLSPHVLYSGSDDSTIRVWDRRSMADGREAGAFLGHTEGISYIDSKGDGRYVLSNGKDQSMKLWDLRKMMTTAKLDTINPAKYSTGFDYRYMGMSDEDYRPHPHDCSVVTFRGHRVLKTLIRCHFSPDTSTNSRYVYTGSADGRIHVYNMDATVAGIINVGETTYNSRPRDSYQFYSAYHMQRDGAEWGCCVRDVSWHPSAPVLAATSWNGWGMSTGTCSVHSWNDGAQLDEVM
ncbi:hypothetical protein FQN55_002845 [Onygenales sp. PD_40]|nr:hypothetical protein FQN55_002845 [Onygenales sp. PD_40]KAK2781790.1 hypothetical protein FQN53_000318 [Emmonsiellopsis sp. PD_33]KAK2782667.1 hypothetical protein FQN52_000767 [Onygenales sp. PD_12]KAK2802171.1 hypothetical protein FQN51_004852 [Onygenales sp. PD_10]